MNYTANTDELTREYFNSILIAPSYLDTCEADTSYELWGEKFASPIMTAALSHLKSCDNAMVEFAKGAKDAGSFHFYGMGTDEELEAVLKTGAKTAKIIKPHKEDSEVFRRIEHAISHGAFAVGMDIDHAISWQGGYDVVLDLPMRTKSTSQLKEYVQCSGETPFIVKGVLSAKDAEKCVEAGVSAILVSHHHGIMNSMIPPLMILPEIVKAVDGQMKIFVDCGFESGMDAFKALAMGADAVGVGRALMDPLKAGSKGVTETIERMIRELKMVMARTGASKLSEIDSSVLRFRNF